MAFVQSQPAQNRNVRGARARRPQLAEDATAAIDAVLAEDAPDELAPTARSYSAPPADDWKPRRLKPLMLPSDYMVVPEPLTDFGRFALRKVIKYETRNELVTIRGRVLIATKNVRGTTRPVAALADGQGQRIWLDAPPAEAAALYARLFELKDKTIALLGRIYESPGKHWWIKYPEPVPGRWLGRPRPVYDMHFQTRRALERRTPAQIAESYLLAAKVQNEYRRSVDDRRTFSTYLNRSKTTLLDDGLKAREEMYVATGETQRKKAGKYIEQVLTLAHRPGSVADYTDAMARIDRIAAVCVMAPQVREGLAKNADRLARMKQFTSPGLPAAFAADKDAFLERMSASIPFDLTGEQRQASREILDDLNSGHPMRRVLSGDVGSGKTAVYGVAVAAMLAAGHRVGVMLPSSLLACQVHAKLCEFIPGVRTSLIADDIRQIDPEARLWVGTVGIHDNIEDDFGFFVADEQQRYSREQRERTVGEGAHLLEVTATCIPRTQALLDTGVLDVSILKECHVKKTLVTRVHESRHKARVFRDVARDIAAGEIVMVIYPGREQDSTDRSGKEIYAVKKYAPIWERHFPGQVAVCHGDQSARENQASVDSIKAGHTSILVATSIVEVGLDIEGVRRVVVVQPERFGLATLHQLRGRAARDGGRGYCDLMLVRDINEGAFKRLKYMEKTTDGFALAAFDLEGRGGGDATADGHRQSGAAPQSPFLDRDTPQEVYTAIAAELAEVYTKGLKRVQRAKVQEIEAQTA